MERSIIWSIDQSRANPEKIHEIFTSFLNDAAVNTFINSLPVNILIVNKSRQVVFANDSCKVHLETESIDTILGLRPGEALCCVNAYLGPDGCGGSEGCLVCGAFKAVVRCLTMNEKTTEEARIRVKRGSGEKTLEYSIDTVPLIFNEDAYAIVLLNDISVQNSKRMMERIFFHDVLNYSSALVNAIDVIEENPLANADIISLLKNTTKMLFNEIHSQKMVMLAETGELTINKTEINIRNLIESVVRFFAMDSICINKEIRILNNENVYCFTDEGLFERILINLLKNALEATRQGGKVTVAYSLQNERVSVTVRNSAIIPRDVQLQIFQKSYSTKGKGRGLGTFSIKLLTERYLGGIVHFVSTEETGTIFTIEFPFT